MLIKWYRSHRLRIAIIEEMSEYNLGRPSFMAIICKKGKTGEKA